MSISKMVDLPSSDRFPSQHGQAYGGKAPLGIADSRQLTAGIRRSFSSAEATALIPASSIAIGLFVLIGFETTEWLALSPLLSLVSLASIWNLGSKEVPTAETPTSGGPHRRTDGAHEQQENIGRVDVKDDSEVINAFRSEDVRRKLALLEFTLEAVPDEIFVKDRKRRLVVANRTFLESKGLSREEAIGLNPDSVLSEKMQGIARESDLAVLERGETFTTQSIDFDLHGNKKYVEIIKKPLYESGEVIGVLGICRNRTENVLAENRIKEQETLLLHATRLSTIGELVAGIAHEVNQPLYSIANYAKALKNCLAQSASPPSLDVQHCVDQILRAAERGGQVTRRLRDFVRRDNSSLEVVDCQEMLQQSVGFVQEEAKLAGVSIEFTQNLEPAPVRLDRVQIQQVLVNLLMNAIEALDGFEVDRPQIELSIHRTSAGIELRVEDNGPGLPAGKADEIFDPFVTTKKDGLGLGLPISTRILSAHGSKLCYAPSAAGGSAFTFVLKEHE